MLLLSTRSYSPKFVSGVAYVAGFDGIEAVIPKEYPPDWSIAGLENVHVIHARSGTVDWQQLKQGLRDALSIAESLGAALVNMHPASGSDFYGGRQNVLEGIKVIKEHSQGPVRISYELLGIPKNSDFATQRAYSTPRHWESDVLEHQLFAAVDPGHISSYGFTPCEFIEKLSENKRLACLYIRDRVSDDRKTSFLPGEGEVEGYWSDTLGDIRKVVQEDSEVVLTFKLSKQFDISLPGNEARLAKSVRHVREYLGRKYL